MWRFIFVTFAFLGSAFYYLSGGADYAPAPNSLQARAEGHTLFAWPDPVETAPQTQTAVTVTAPDNTVSRAVTSLTDLSLAAKARTGTVRLQLASAGGSQFPVPEPAIATDDTDAVAAAVARDVAKAPAPTPQSERDIRQITGSTVNMRSGPGTEYSPVTRLSGGTEVAVLRDPGNGWLKLRVVDTGREGWMADWLVTTAN